MTTTHHARSKRPRAQHGESEASSVPSSYRPPGWHAHFADVPTLDGDLAKRLRDSRITGVLASEADEAEASRQIAVSCRALRAKFAAVSGGRWAEE